MDPMWTSLLPSALNTDISPHLLSTVDPMKVSGSSSELAIAIAPPLPSSDPMKTSFFHLR